MAVRPLSLEEREEIRAGIERQESFRNIATKLGRAPSSVSREVRRNRGRDRYSAVLAERRAAKRRRRPKQFKFEADRLLAKKVEAFLRAGVSPAAIAVLLRREGGPTVVAETIYRALYSTTFRGLTLRSHRCLRMRRRMRRPRSKSRNQRIAGPFRPIETRPQAANDRVELGHWEGDLLMGSVSRSAVITLVERLTRYVLVFSLKDGKRSEDVIAVLEKTLGSLPPGSLRSLTWDRGGELARWATLEKRLNIPVFFCNPSSPWERPSNENTNRQLRFWLPKGTDLNQVPEVELNRATAVLNHQPRRAFEWESAAERYARLALR